MDDEDDEIITVQSDVDQVAEESGSTPLCLSEDDSPENGSPDTRSEEDKCETELLEQGRAEVTEEEPASRPKEGTTEAVQSSSDEGENTALRDVIQTSMGESSQTLPDIIQTPEEGVLTREVGPLGTTHERGSVTEARLTTERGDVESADEVIDTYSVPSQKCIIDLARYAQRLTSCYHTYTL